MIDKFAGTFLVFQLSLTFWPLYLNLWTERNASLWIPRTDRRLKDSKMWEFLEENQPNMYMWTGIERFDSHTRGQMSRSKTRLWSYQFAQKPSTWGRVCEYSKLSRKHYCTQKTQQKVHSKCICVRSRPFKSEMISALTRVLPWFVPGVICFLFAIYYLIFTLAKK